MTETEKSRVYCSIVVATSRTLRESVVSRETYIMVGANNAKSPSSTGTPPFAVE